MKIAVIGGAGIRTVNFIGGLLDRCEELDIQEVALYDIDREKLEIIGLLCRYVAGRSGASLRVSSVPELREALRGADYVAVAIRVGGDRSRVLDEEVAIRHKVIAQETTGAGGFFMAMRTIPPLLEYCRVIREVCPDAWIFNFSNPSGLVTQALSDAGYRRVIGICDAPSSVKTRMAARLGVEEDALHLKMFGLNHLSWIQSVKCRGEELLPRLLEDASFLEDIPEFAVFDRDVHKLTNYLPNEYLYYYYHRERALRNILTAKVRRGEQIQQLNRCMWSELEALDIRSDPEKALQTFLYYIYRREYSYMAAEAGRKNGPAFVERGGLPIPKNMGYAGVLLDCIRGLQCDLPREVVACVPNQGCIPFLRDNDIAELSCQVDVNGFHPAELEPDIPEHCVQLISAVKSYERMAVQAIRTGSDLLAAGALSLPPLVFSFSLAKELLQDYKRAWEKETASL